MPRKRLIAIGSSTGGVVALEQMIRDLGGNVPGIVITQHIPANFVAQLAARLSTLGAIRVREAAHGDTIEPGCAYIAPGDRHLCVRRSAARGLVCALEDGPPVSGHKPSVDVLFASVAETVGAQAIGVILTGMGQDGARGLLTMRQSGAATLGQDERSCVVYGMPRAARALQAVQQEVPLKNMAAAVLRLCVAQPQPAS